MEIKTRWETKPHWLRGGMLGVVFVLAYYFLFTVIFSNLFPGQSESLSAPVALPFILSSIWFEGAYFEIVSFVVLLLFYFSVGAIIGWVIGKNKK